MRKPKSIFKILHKYRNYNQVINDHSYKLYKRKKKVEDFRNLVLIANDETTSAYLNQHTHVILIINKDLYIDHIIYLYDRRIHFFNSNNLEEKTKKLLDIYYNSAKDKFIDSLYENGFISLKLKDKLRKECLL